MAQIDKFIALMAQSGATGAVLVGDRPGQVFIDDRTKPGPMIPASQLHRVVQEITPENLQAQLGQDSAFHFSYQSPHGVFDISIEQPLGALQISVTPAALPTVSTVETDTPVVQDVVDPVAEHTVEHITEPVMAEPVVAEPALEVAAEPVVGDTAELTVEETIDPVVDTAPELTVEDLVEPIVDDAESAIADSEDTGDSGHTSVEITASTQGIGEIEPYSHRPASTLSIIMAPLTTRFGRIALTAAAWLSGTPLPHRRHRRGRWVRTHARRLP